MIVDLVLAITAIFSYSSKISAQEAGGATYQIIYHDSEGSVVLYDDFVKDYTFNSEYPSFFTGIGKMNTAWNTQADGKGTTYSTGSKLESLDKDLDVYPMLVSGHYVRFDSKEGTPIRYQFVNDGGNATKPVNPTRMGYTFAGWTLNGANYTFSQPVKEDIILVAKWNPAQTQYTIRIWLENSDREKRTSLSDAQSHVEEDFSYGGAITKNALSGSTVEFTQTDQNSNEYKKIVYYTYNGSTYIEPQYFLDNDNGSYAKDMTDASINSVNNNEKVKGDGTTVVNVYLRELYYNTKLSDNTGTIVNKATSYSMKQRVDEEVGHAIIRNGVTLNANFEALLKRTYDELEGYFYIKHYTRFEKVEYVTHVQMWADTGDDAVLFNAYSKNNLQDKENMSITIELGQTGDVLYKRYWYEQTLESALNNEFSITKIDDTKFNSFEFADIYEKYTSNKEEINNGWSTEDYEGFTLYYVDIADRHGSTVEYLKSNTRINGTEWSKTNGVAETGYLNGEPKRIYGPAKYPPYKNTKSGTIYWQLDQFFLRNSYEVAFVTFNEKIKVKSNDKFNKVFFEEPLNKIAPYVVKSDGSNFVIGETSYQDDQLVRWVFQGWYDNITLSGTPIDFSTTKLTMPAKNIVFYAKWEAQPLHATFIGNGGTIEGKTSIVEEFLSGNVPLKPSDPTPPTGMKFLCWTLDGVYYDFSETLFEDVEIVAQYYSDEKLKVTYDAGEGSGKVPVDANTYTYNANPKVKSPTAELIAPKGKYFSHWEFDKKDYLPNDVVYVTKNVTLVAAYDDYLKLTIKKKGMNVGESASFTVTKTGDAKPSFTVLLTGNGDEYAEISIMGLDPGEYTVAETSWSWAYNETPLSPQKKTIAKGSDNTFTFVNVEKDVTPLHSEAIKDNDLNDYQ